MLYVPWFWKTLWKTPSAVVFKLTAVIETGMTISVQVKPASFLSCLSGIANGDGKATETMLARRSGDFSRENIVFDGGKVLDISDSCWKEGSIAPRYKLTLGDEIVLLS